MVVMFIVQFVCFVFMRYTSALQQNCDNENINGMNELQCSPRDLCNSREIRTRAGLVQLEWVKFQERSCFCDEDCSVYGDCCSDYLKNEHTRVIPKDTFQCEIVTGIFSFGLPIYVVDKCPSQWADSTIRSFCEEDAPAQKGLILNWFVSDDNLVLYRNLYCALCHGKTNVTYWRARIACDMVVVLDGDLQSQNIAHTLLDRIEEGVCRVKYDTPEDTDKKRFFRLCKPLLNKCAEDWQGTCVKEQCEGPGSISSYVYSRSRVKTYKNKFCALCNHADDVNCSDTVTRLMYQPVLGTTSESTFYPLNIIFDLNPGDGPIAEYKIGAASGQLINETVSELRACPDQHVYDPFIGRCRFVICRSGFMYKRGECVSYENRTYGDGTIDDCVLIILNKTEYVLLSNGSVFVNASEAIYNFTDFEITDSGTALVCSNLTQNFTESYYEVRSETIIKFSRTQGIVSVVGQIISIVCLILHIIVYSIFPNLRNLAGKCILCLAASLLVAQILFLVGVSTSSIDATEHFGLCAGVAVTTHFAFLASFMWMNVIAFDICRTFSGAVQKSSTGSLKKRFYKYNIYGWIVPFSIVALAVALDRISSTSSLRPAYGERLCWFNNRKSLFIFFALPVGLIMAANILLFILTAIHICNVQKTAKMLMKKNDTHRYGLYIKLFIIMGLTWIFAFIATSTDSEALWYLFLIFNTLQGAFIFFSFVFTKQVLNLLREKYSKLREVYGRSTTSEAHTMSTSLSSRKASSVSTNLIIHKL